VLQATLKKYIHARRAATMPTRKMPSKTPGEIRRAPLLGEHNEYVYREVLGYSEEEVNQLITEGVLE
jgi:crotonobetainyl-CoA:carnitine CoA-transferase CaiB-like acyl-CoA transferase